MKFLFVISLSILAACGVESAEVTTMTTSAIVAGDYTVNTVHFQLLDTGITTGDGRVFNDAQFLDSVTTWAQYNGLVGGVVTDQGIIDAVAGWSKPRSFIAGMNFRLHLIQ